MANFTRREIVSRRVEYAVPSPAYNDELEKALACAYTDYRRAHNLADDAAPWGDWLRVESRDDEIVISYTLDAEVSR